MLKNSMLTWIFYYHVCWLRYNLKCGVRLSLLEVVLQGCVLLLMPKLDGKAFTCELLTRDLSLQGCTGAFKTASHFGLAGASVISGTVFLCRRAGVEVPVFLSALCWTWTILLLCFFKSLLWSWTVTAAAWAFGGSWSCTLCSGLSWGPFAFCTLTPWLLGGSILFLTSVWWQLRPCGDELLQGALKASVLSWCPVWEVLLSCTLVCRKLTGSFSVLMSRVPLRQAWPARGVDLVIGDSGTLLVCWTPNCGVLVPCMLICWYLGGILVGAGVCGGKLWHATDEVASPGVSGIPMFCCRPGRGVLLPCNAIRCRLRGSSLVLAGVSGRWIGTVMTAELPLGGDPGWEECSQLCCEQSSSQLKTHSHDVAIISCSSLLYVEVVQQ